MNIILIILLLNANPVVQEVQKLDTIYLEFERKVVQDDAEEVVKGVAHYQSPGKALIEVKEPLSQMMLIEGSEMLIYYPVEKKAYRIKAKGSIPMPFVQSILSVMKDDYGLTDMGYVLAKHEKKGDTLYTYWDPPDKLKDKLGRFTLGTVNGVLVYAEARKRKGKDVAKTFYSKHIELAGKHFPTEVRSEITEGKRFTQEFISYANLKINIQLPERVTSFSIPDSVPVKEVEW